MFKFLKKILNKNEYSTSTRFIISRDEYMLCGGTTVDMLKHVARLLADKYIQITNESKVIKLNGLRGDILYIYLCKVYGELPNRPQYVWLRVPTIPSDYYTYNYLDLDVEEVVQLTVTSEPVVSIRDPYREYNYESIRSSAGTNLPATSLFRMVRSVF